MSNLIERLKHSAIPKWSNLAGFGNSKLFKSSYFWLIAVPLLAKVLSKVGPEINVTLCNYSWKFVIELPFSWKVFYFSSVCFSSAMLLYWLFCPEIVKNYKTYVDFEGEGKGRRQVRDYLIAYIWSQRFNNDLLARIMIFFQDFTKREKFPEDNIKTNFQLVNELCTFEIVPERVPDAFWYEK